VNETEKTLTREELINNLLLKFGVTLRAVYDCSVKEEETIRNIKRIFSLETTTDKQRCLALLYMLTSGKDDEVIDYFREENSISGDIVINEKIARKNAPLLTTALMNNGVFFAMSVNLCGILKYKAALRKIIPFPTGRRLGFNPVLFVDYLAASGGGFREFNRSHLEEPKGILKLLGKEQDGLSKFMFEFEFDEYQETPCFLDVHFITQTDSVEHTLSLSKEKFDKHKSIIMSKSETGIKYAGGIAIDWIEIKNR
jgi:hypothetical protein